jgi:putative ABC transport system permease protein
MTWGAFGINTVLVLGVLSLFIFIGPWPSEVSGGATGFLAITAGDGRSLTTADSDAIVKSVPGLTLVSRIIVGTAPVNSGTGERFAIQAVDASYALLPGAGLAHGAFFTPDDAVAANRVAVLGGQAATTLFPGSLSPVGQTIRIGNVAFSVVGVLANPASDAILIPFQTGQVRVFGTAALGEVVVQARDASQTDAIVQSIESLLRTRHQVRAAQPDDFTIHQPTFNGTPIQPIDRFRYLAGEYACQAKGICLPA